MNNKPMIFTNDDIFEGVYAASGCYTASAHIHQWPETGREDYRIQVDGVHAADHIKETQWLHISFNQPVHYKECNMKGATLEAGDGTSSLRIRLTYHQNPTDNIGAGDLVVTSDTGLAITSVSITD